MDFGEQALELHKHSKGKIGTELKVPLKDKNDLSLAYTPGVAKVSQTVADDPEQAYVYTIKQNTIAVVSDGSAVLGLGNIGPLGALPVMEGKCALFKRFANVDAFPICLNTQDPEEIIETVKRIAPVFGGINLEDISAPRCFEVERRLKNELDIPVMHDDQHGTAVVVLAALVNALKISGKEKSSVKVVINGAGAAGIAVAKLLSSFGVSHILVCDTQGIIDSNRAELTDAKKDLLTYVNMDNESGNLASAMVGADVFIGVSKANLLSKDMVRTMNSKSIVFALANPVPEISPEDAKEGGAYIYASGRSDYPNQINNVLAFPGLFRGALDTRLKEFTNEHFIKAAQAIAEAVPNPSTDSIIPSPFTVDLSAKVAASIS